MTSPRSTIAALVVYSVALVFMFFWLGLNTGVMLSMRDGPTSACRSLRISILNCDWQDQK